MTPIPQERTTREVAPVPPVVQGALPAVAPRDGSGGAPTPKVPAGKEPTTMTAPNAAEQEPAEEAAKELPKRAPKPRGRALAVAAEPAQETPEAAAEAAPETPAPTPEPAPKWPPIWPALTREFSHLATPLPDAFAGMMAFNGMTVAHEAKVAEGKREALDASAAILTEADQRHEEKRANSRYVKQDVCTYAGWADLPRCPVDGTPRGAIYVEGARTLAEVATDRAEREEVEREWWAKNPPPHVPAQHHEPRQHPWLDTMALELSATGDGEAATDG